MDSSDDNRSFNWKLLTFTLGVGLLSGWKLKRFFTNNWPEFSLKQKLILVVRSNDRELTQGQIASYCASASILAYKTSKQQNPLSQILWSISGQPKVILRSYYGYDFEQICNEAKKLNICTCLIKEMKKTKSGAEGKTKDVILAVGPGPSAVIDRITGHMKLY